jgi:hypothetical protein
VLTCRICGIADKNVCTYDNDIIVHDDPDDCITALRARCAQLEGDVKRLHARVRNTACDECSGSGFDNFENPCAYCDQTGINQPDQDLRHADTERLNYVIGETYENGMQINGCDVAELVCEELDKNPTEEEWNATVRRIAREQIDAARSTAPDSEVR